jgi:ribosomal protein S12 methylthiotransferase accessory factor YcaO
LPCRGLALDVLLVRLIDRLRELGFKQVLRHRFDLDLGGLQVVKVVVPGCEVIDRRLERMGPRLRERVRALDA